MTPEHPTDLAVLLLSRPDLGDIRGGVAAQIVGMAVAAA